MEWKEYTVQQLIDLGMIYPPMDGNHGGKYPKASEYVEEGVPFVMANNFKNGVVDYSSCVFLTTERTNQLDKGFSYPGDVLLTHKATIGKTAIVNDEYPLIMLTPQVTYYRIIKDIDKWYLKYYFDSFYFQNLFQNWAGAGSTRAYLGVTAQRKLPIILPPLAVQTRIASILSSLDRKIELNNKINAQLEEMAQAIFKSWFVDFEPFKDGKFVESELGMIPEGWRVGTLTEIANYVNGLAMQKFPPANEKDSLPVLKIKELGQGQTDSSSDRCSLDIKPNYIINDGDVIFSWSGTLIVDIWCGGKCGLNQHLFKVTSNEYPKWFYLYWTKHHLDKFIRIAKDKAVTMGHIKRGELDASLVAIPDATSMKTIDSQMAPIVNLLIANRITNRTLSQLRDTLLPKLMSGEIDLDEIEKTI